MMKKTLIIVFILSLIILNPITLGITSSDKYNNDFIYNLGKSHIYNSNFIFKFIRNIINRIDNQFGDIPEIKEISNKILQSLTPGIPILCDLFVILVLQMYVYREEIVAKLIDLGLDDTGLYTAVVVTLGVVIVFLGVQATIFCLGDWDPPSLSYPIFNNNTNIVNCPCIQN